MTKEEIKTFVDATLAGTPLAADATEKTVDLKIREAISFFINAVAPDARVYYHDTLSTKPEAWANLFKKTGEDETETVHGWVIKRADLTDEWHRQTSDKLVYFYDVWGFYQFFSESNTDNSDIKFQKVVDAICFVLQKQSRLGLDCCVYRHELLQFAGIDTLGEGDEQLHFAPGRLEVRLCY